MMIRIDRRAAPLAEDAPFLAIGQMTLSQLFEMIEVGTNLSEDRWITELTIADGRVSYKIERRPSLTFINCTFEKSGTGIVIP